MTTGGWTRTTFLSSRASAGAIASGTVVRVRNVTRGEEFVARHGLSSRQVELLLAGGLIPWLRDPAAVAVT